MPAFSHEPVLLAGVLEHLSPRDQGVYVDCTTGGAGHSSAILNATRDSRLIGLDRDPAALAAARERLYEFGSRVTLVHAEMSDLATVLADLNIGQVDGILADLGVSSPQLDHADRGFSFMNEGPLDMRMDPTRGQTAADLIRETDVDALANLIYELGEERHSRKVARVIKEAIAGDRAHTTTQLAAAIATAIPPAEQRKSKIHPATRTFQALRIAVNGELDQLAALLAGFPALLAPGGRCAVISFHSLEDRLVKQRFRDLAWTSSLPPRLAVEAGERVAAVCEPVTRKAVVADDAEAARNPRSRSARLRVCERTSAADEPAHVRQPH